MDGDAVFETGVLADIVLRNARLSRDRPAIYFEDRMITFGQFAERALRLANGIRALGVTPGSRVSMLAHNCPAYLEFFAACELAGFIAVPINYRLAVPEIRDILDNATPSAVLYAAAFRNTVAPLQASHGQTAHWIAVDAGVHDTPDLVYETLLRSGATAPPAEMPKSDDDAYIIHTSGTTGRPKGAIVPHQAYYRAALAVGSDAGLLPTDLGLIVQPLFHMGAKLLQLAHHIRSAAIVLHGDFDVSRVWNTLRRQPVTTAQLAPTMIDMLLADAPRKRALPLHTIFYSTAPIREELLRRGLAYFGQVFVQHYGSTEAGVVTTLARHQHRVDGSPREQRWLHSAGQPGLGVNLRIAGHDGQALPAGETGEVWVRHAAMGSGYWQDPLATGAAFKDGWLKMGDMARQEDDGFLYIVDRKKDMIISGGENIYPREVENALNGHPAVAECAVIGVPDERWGESVLAIVVLRRDQVVDGAALIDHCRSCIASYKKPKRVVFASALPRLATGKIDKVQLRAGYWRGHERNV